MTAAHERPGQLAVVPATVPVAAVTVLEDRAQVVRRGAVEVPAGRVLLVVQDVAPVLSDKTLAASLVGETPARVVDARVRRRLRALVQDRPEDVARLERQLEELRERDRALGDRVTVLEQRATMLDALAVGTYEDLSVDVTFGRPPDEGVDARVREAEASLDELARQQLAVRRQREELALQVRDLERQRAALARPSSERRAAVEVELQVERAGRLELKLEYVVPGACWRPQHRARLQGERLWFETDGCVWQNTGEDWTAVELACSTQRPSLGTSPPLLDDDELSVQPKAQTLVVEQREQAVQTTGLGAVAGRREAPELPGVDDGGQVRHLVAPGRATIPSDGRPWRVPLTRFEADAKVSLLAVPELAPSAFLRAESTNAGSTPVLAGPVDLIRDSGYVGRTTLLFVAPGERLELSFGPDPEVRLQRHDDVKEQEPGLLGSWFTVDHALTLKVSNLGATGKSLVIKERIPVSELEKVKVSWDRTAANGDPDPPDAEGLLSWKVKLEPRGRQTLKAAWKLERHKDVVGL